MRKIFVTGSNGFLGTNIILNLLDKGYYVRGLVRSIKLYRGVYHPNLELVQGDMLMITDKFLEGCDSVIHVAAETSINLTSYDDYKQPNYIATINLFNYAILAKIKKFIFISSANSLGHGSLENPGCETIKIREPFLSSYYAQSKLEAEKYLLKKKHLIDVIIVNPTFMLGPHDTKPTSGKIIYMGLNKKVILYPPGGKNFVHVGDVAEGVVSSLHKGRNGEKYLLANENISYYEFFQKLNIATNQSPIMIKIPRVLMLSVGYIGDVLRLLKIKTPLSSVNMKILCTKNYYSNNKSITELGVKYRSLDKAINEALAFFQRC